MTHSRINRVVTVVNPLGIHLRPAGLIANTANRFAAQVEVVKGGDRFDARSVLSLLTLAAGQGTQLALQAHGPDAEPALDALAELFAQGFHELEAASEQAAPAAGLDA